MPTDDRTVAAPASPVGGGTGSRRRLSVDDRRRELLAACLGLIGRRPWAEVSMADVARAAGASKPLLYHYFATKPELYRAAVQWAAEELAAVTTPPPGLAAGDAVRHGLTAHLRWVAANAEAYRAVLQGGVSADSGVEDVIDASRNRTVERLARSAGLVDPTARQWVVLRGWVGFLEGATLGWLARRDLGEEQMVDVLATSARALLASVTL